MEDLPEILQRHGKERELSPGEVLCRQGSPSDGIYYLRQGRLGVYREEWGSSFPLSEIGPGELVGELGATTGRSRTATVKAEETSRVIHVSEADFRRVLDEAPGLAAEIVRQIVEKLLVADTARVTLGRSYQQEMERVRALHSQKARLEELLRLREEVADTIVHDLRNPLGVLSAGLALLARRATGGVEPKYEASVLDMMERSVRRMQHMVDTLLDIAALEEERMTLQLLPLDLRVLVEEVVQEEQPPAETRRVALESQLPAELPPVLADRDVLQRVLFNLVDNALKFTPANGRVCVEARPQGETLRVEVIDTGPGIPLGQRERIFEKFTQVQGRTGAKRGSGLGLAFCRLAIEAHGGRIWVEDGPGGAGSRFAFTLPRAP